MARRIRRRDTTPAMSGTEALTKLLVQLGEVARAHDLEGFDPPGYEQVQVVLPGLTVGQVRAAYPELHRMLLGRWPEFPPGVPANLPEPDATPPLLPRASDHPTPEHPDGDPDPRGGSLPDDDDGGPLAIG